jgi:hypothetical protein
MPDKQQQQPIKPDDVQPPAPTPPDPDFTPVATVPDEPAPPQPTKKLPHRTADGKLTRAGMEHHVKAGGSVMHGGQIITDVAELPHDADLAKGDTEREKQVAQSLDEQIAALSRERAKLGQPKSTPLGKAGIGRVPTEEDLRDAVGEINRLQKRLDELLVKERAQQAAKPDPPKVEAKPVTAAADDPQAKAQQAEDSKREATQQQAGKGGKK